MSATTYSKGKYRAEVVDQGFEQSSGKGTPCFFLQIRILARYDEQGQAQECPRYERTYRQYLNTETGVNILRGQLKSLDVQVTGLAQLDPGAANHVSLVGRTIDVACELESYRGRQQERWSIPQ